MPAFLPQPAQLPGAQPGMPMGAPWPAFQRPPDGSEATYLVPGPSNRLTLSLRSGIPSQMDWALQRLIDASFKYPEHLNLELFPGLADVLVSFPRRVANAVLGHPPSTWDPAHFEHQSSSSGEDEYGDSGFSEDWADTDSLAGPARKRARMTEARMNNLISLVNHAGQDADLQRKKTAGTKGNATAPLDEISQEAFSFNPAHNPEHAALMRRALEASLVLRNLTLHAPNVEKIIGVRRFSVLLKEVLELPDVILVVAPDRKRDAEGNHIVQRKVGGLRGDHEEWLELEGINEMRLHFLDMLEVLAPKVGLSKRAPFEVTQSGDEVNIANTETYSEFVPGSGRTTRPGNGIFLRLLHMVNHSNDRALVIGALRCLSVMAATESNEAAFVELDTPDGNLSPGLLRRCVELVCATSYDNDLLEWTLELLYRLLNCGHNAFRLCSRSITSSALASSSTSESATGAPADAKAQSGTMAFVRALVRILTVNKSVWERDHALVPSLQRWVHNVPSRLRTEALQRLTQAEKKHRKQIAQMNMTLEQRAQQKKLTPRERKRLIGLKEPERAAEWMKILFEADDESEVTQIEFWNAYKEEMTSLVEQGEAPMQVAGDLIRQASIVFPRVSAMSLPGVPGGPPQRFVLQRLAVRDRSARAEHECQWSACQAPETTRWETARAHAIAHASLTLDGRCRWKHCEHVEARAKYSSLAAQRGALCAHVLTHLPPTKRDLEERTGQPKQQQQQQQKDQGDELATRATSAGRPFPVQSDRSLIEPYTMRNGARALRGKEGALDMSAFQHQQQQQLNAKGAANPTAAAIPPPTNTNPPNGRQTLDDPGLLTFTVARTPLDAHENGMGCAATAALILRSLARSAASMLDRASVRPPFDYAVDATLGDDEAEAAGPGEGVDGASAARVVGEQGGELEERFGLPLPPGGEITVDATKAVNGTSKQQEQKEPEPSAKGNKDAENPDREGEEGSDDAGGAAGDALLNEMAGSTEDWVKEAAIRLADALVAVEEEMMLQSSENDVLCRMLNDTLMELRPAKEESLFARLRAQRSRLAAAANADAAGQR